MRKHGIFYYQKYKGNACENKKESPAIYIIFIIFIPIMPTVFDAYVPLYLKPLPIDYLAFCKHPDLAPFPVKGISKTVQGMFI